MVLFWRVLSLPAKVQGRVETPPPVVKASSLPRGGGNSTSSSSVHGRHGGQLAIAEKDRGLGVLVGQPGDVEGQQVVEGRARVLRQAAIPHEHLFRLVEQAHGIDHQRGAHARHLAAVGHDADAGCLGLGVQLELLADQVGVAAQVAHAGPGLHGGPA